MLSFSSPQPINSKHNTAAFSCGTHLSLDQWLKQYAISSAKSGSSRTFVSCINSEVVGYYSLTAGSIEFNKAPDRLSKGMPQYPIPYILLARLAVDTRFQKRGVGYSLLQDAFGRVLNIAEDIGIRAFLTEAIDNDASKWYQQYGFMPFVDKPQMLYMLLKDIRKTLVS